MNRINCILLILLSFGLIKAYPCTSYLVSKGATTDGSTLISYAGDSHIRYGQIYFRPAAKWPLGSMMTIYDRSSNRPLGEIPQANETYKVLGFMNEHQVAIGESTFGGRYELTDTLGKIDWGSIMFLGLQRAKTAREAIKVMVELLNEHGYYSSGQSYSIADPNEVWILEIMGKGMDIKTDKKTKKIFNARKGIVWVARRIPDGYISAHANHSRITNFPMEDGKTSISCKNLSKIFEPSIETVYSHDVIDFARQMKYFNGKDEDFSFSEAYAPLDFGAARFCELRVWAMYNHASDGMEKYWDYAIGKAKGPRMPLWIKPNRKLTPQDLMTFKGDYLQGTELDMTKDAGAGPQEMPYRWRPMTWKYNDKEYFHERVTATQQTAFSWVAQMRSFMPNPIGGIFWYGLDDANLSVHAPFYIGTTSVPYAYQVGNGDILTYSESSAFWIFNRVSHTIYLFYNNAIEDVRKKQKSLSDKFVHYVTATDAAALAIYKENPEMAIQYLTEFSHNNANSMLAEWKEFGNFLLVKYLDGNIKQEKDGKFLRNQYDFPLSPKHPNYSDEWKKTIIESTGDKFLVPPK
jgi:dipeptidase